MWNWKYQICLCNICRFVRYPIFNVFNVFKLLLYPRSLYLFLNFLCFFAFWYLSIHRRQSVIFYDDWTWSRLLVKNACKFVSWVYCWWLKPTIMYFCISWLIYDWYLSGSFIVHLSVFFLFKYIVSVGYVGLLHSQDYPKEFI